jgi:hypothetical protein
MNGRNLQVARVSSAYRAQIYDDQILVTTASGEIPITLYSMIDGGEHSVFIKNEDGINSVVVSASGGTINGASSYTMSAAGQGAFFEIDDRGNWNTFEIPQSAIDALATPAFVTLTDGSTVTWSFAGKKTGNAKVTLAGSRTLSLTGLTNGATGTLKVVQGAGGGHGLTLPANSIVINDGSGAVALSPDAGDVDLLCFVYDGSSILWNVGLKYT